MMAMHQQLSIADIVIKRCVEDIWSHYDNDGNGVLDKEETKRFVMEQLEEIDEGKVFDDDDFDECFRNFDVDGSGTIDKEEMVEFIKKAAGI
mmetsp:Transcript_17760/g.22374  ORF Transcript_17760/g.22374 Transcript_17760/m.22374 type:complete len:92 (+) Transcript_17760:101-376(+)